jgi:hypothetical protein
VCVPETLHAAAEPPFHHLHTSRHYPTGDQQRDDGVGVAVGVALIVTGLGLVDYVAVRLVRDGHTQDAVSGQRGVGRGAQDPRRTPDSWRGEPLAYSDTDRISNSPTEAINLLIKKVRRVGHGLRNFHNYRLRLLLHWDVEWHTPDATCLSRPASPRRKCCANGDRPDRGSRIGSETAGTSQDGVCLMRRSIAVLAGQVALRETLEAARDRHWFVHTEEVTGSIPVSPTSANAPSRSWEGAFDYRF